MPQSLLGSKKEKRRERKRESLSECAKSVCERERKTRKRDKERNIERGLEKILFTPLRDYEYCCLARMIAIISTFHTILVFYTNLDFGYSQHGMH